MTSTESCGRVLVADPQPLIALGIRSLLAGEPGIAVVGSAQSEREAMRWIEDHRPDIVLLDPGLPGLSGVGLARWLTERAASTRVILLAGRDESAHAQHALQSGARGYVLKRSDPEVLLQAIRATLAGGVYIDPAAVAQVISIKQSSPGRPFVRQTSGAHLTEREREVFRLIAFGLSHKEIAGKLGITSKSVETYKMRASEKLDIRTRAKIVQYAMLQGWLHDMAD